MTPPATRTNVIDPLHPTLEPVAGKKPDPVPSAAPPPTPSYSSTPFRLQMSGGYTSLKLGREGPVYSGGLFQANAGQSFYVHPQHAFFLDGVFRLGGLNDGAGNDVSLVHFGLQGGYEASVAPDILSVFLYGGLGSNILYSKEAGVAPSVTRSLNNQAMLALTLGGGFALGHGIFVFNGGFQPNFGLEIPPPEGGAARGFNPMGYSLMGGLDLARLVAWAGGRFPQEASIGQFVGGITPGLILDTTYTANLGKPTNSLNALRVFDTRADRPMFNYGELSLDRPTDAENPFGFRLDFGLGENSRVAKARSSFSGEGYDLQQFYARSRLPVGDGLTLRGGKFATLVGTEVMESLNNNHISHSFQFGLAEPFTHLGVTGEYPIVPERLTATTGIINGWDNVLDRSAGIGWLGALTGNPTSWLSLSGASTVGSENGRLRSIVDFIAAVKVNDEASTGGGFDRFTASATYDWGHEGAGAALPASNWHALGVTARVGFIPEIGFAQGFEVFLDPDGARTGTSQTMWSTRSTIQMTPFAGIDSPWARGLRLRGEFRHDRSSQSSFLAGSMPATFQSTVGTQLGFVY